MVSLLLSLNIFCVSIGNFVHMITGWVVISVSPFPITGWQPFKSIFFRSLKAEQCNFLEPLLKENHRKNKVMTENKRAELMQLRFACPKSTMGTPEERRKSVQS